MSSVKLDWRKENEKLEEKRAQPTMGLRSSVIEMRCSPLLRAESPQIRLAINVVIFFVMHFL